MTTMQNPTAERPSRLKRPSYTPDEWEEKKEFINRLLRGRKTQIEVLKELETEYPGFRPTLAMLKKRIRIWRIGPNHNEADIAEALRIMFQREAQSRRTAFVINERHVTRREIDRYLFRRGVRDPRAFVPRSRAQRPPSAIRFYTPPPTPPILPVLTAQGPIEPAELSRSDNCMLPGQYEILSLTTDAFLAMWSERHRPQASLAGPPELEQLQMALLSNDAYFQSIFAPETFATASATSLVKVDRLDIFTNGMWRGRDLLIEGQLKSAFKCFNEAFDVIRPIIEEQSRRFLPELFEMLLNFQLEENLDILQILLAFIARMCWINGNVNDLLLQIAASLLQMNRSDRVDAVERLMQNALDHFEINIGQDQPESQSIVKALSRSIFRRQPVSRAIGHLPKLLQEDCVVTSMSAYEHCTVLVEIALCHRVKNRLAEATDWIQRAWLQADTIDSFFHQTDIKVRCLRVTSYIRKKTGDWQGSYDLARAAVSVAMLGLGSEESLTALVKAEVIELENQANASGVLLREPSILTGERVSLFPLEVLSG